LRLRQTRNEKRLETNLAEIYFLSLGAVIKSMKRLRAIGRTSNSNSNSNKAARQLVIRDRG
jgi:hypothetical protein